MNSKEWTPPLSFEETVRAMVVPARMYVAHELRRELRVGERELRLLPFLAPRDRVALDVGANKGVWSMALSRLVDEVHAFEPNPKMFRVLDRALGGRVHTHQIALSDRTGVAEFRVPKTRKGYSNQGGSLSTTKVAGPHGALEVPTRRLDDLDIRNVGFMKIDVEGFEAEVIRGATETIRRDRPILVVEMEEKHTRRPIEEMVGEVTALGYDCFVLRAGALTRFETVDLDAHHRKPARGKDYIFNFIFIPKPAGVA
jgi:FkbM family methyltransferase